MIGLIIKSDIEPRLEQVCNVVLKGLRATNVIDVIQADTNYLSEKDVKRAEELTQMYDRVMIIAMNVDITSDLLDEIERFNAEKGETVVRLYQYYEEIFPKLSLDLLVNLSEVHKDFDNQVLMKRERFI